MSDIARALAEEILDPRVAPGAAAAWARVDGELAKDAVGATSFEADSARVADDTPFDLASLTKPVVALTAARLERAGHLARTDRLCKWLPELAEVPAGQSTLELLLAHRAGLAAHVPLFEPLVQGRPVERTALLRRAASALREDLPAAPGEPRSALYSDLGYLLIGAALERACGRDLDDIVRREVTEPLRLELDSVRGWARRAPERLRRAAATEVVPWRGGLLRGVVHDENAWALAGHGHAGHAGLFGTAEAVAQLGRAVLLALSGDSEWLDREGVAWLVERRAGGSLRAGFDGTAGPESSAGPTVGVDTFGHLGFTGTSLWCDPQAGVAVALLTNRVCPTREHPLIRAARPRLGSRLFSLARGKLATTL